MKNSLFTLLVMLITLKTSVWAQESKTSEKYGNTLNLGGGIGYFGYVGHALPVGMLNYEFDVAKNFTIAPFAGIYSYQNYYYWGNPNKPSGDPSYRLYSYRATAIPIGAKGTYYFDQLFHAQSKWDFYAAGSLGFVFRNVVWENGYSGNKNVYHNSSPLFLEAHIGSEYHFNQKVGMFLDLSTGMSTFGIAFHF